MLLHTLLTKTPVSTKSLLCQNVTTNKMQFKVLLTFGLMAIVHALPTINFRSSTSSSELQKRMSYGWIGTFWHAGCTTSGPLPSDASPDDPEHGFATGPRPELKKEQCQVWSPAYPVKNVGIDWGSGQLEFHHLRVYATTDCSGSPDVVIHRKGGEPGACVSLDDFGQYVLWNSVMAVW